MSETMFLSFMVSIVAGLFSILTIVIGWMGARVITRLDDMVQKLHEVKDDLHNRINGIDRRLTTVEVEVKRERN